MARPELIYELKKLQNARLSDFRIKDGKRGLKIPADRQLLLLISIHSYFGDNTFSFPSRETLAWNCQWIAEDTPEAIQNGVRQVRRTMKALAEQQIVIVSRRKKGYYYFIAFDKIPQRIGATRGSCGDPPMGDLVGNQCFQQPPPVAVEGATHGTQKVPPVAAKGATRGPLTNQEILKNTTTTQSGGSSFEEEVNQNSERWSIENLDEDNQESKCAQPRTLEESAWDVNEFAFAPRTFDANTFNATTNENKHQDRSIDLKKFDDKLNLLKVKCKTCLKTALENQVEPSEIDRFLSDAVEAKNSGALVEPGLIFNLLNNATKHLPPKHDFMPKPTKNKKTVGEVREYERQRIVLQLRNRKISQDEIELLVNLPFSSGVPVEDITSKLKHHFQNRKNNFDSIYSTSTRDSASNQSQRTCLAADTTANGIRI